MQDAEMIFSVSELNRYVNALLSADPHLNSLKVTGEISGFKRHSSGHLYFSLKDESAVVPCVMFKSSAQQLRFLPEDGKKVLIEGRASLYTKGGTFQVYVDSMEDTGAGELFKRFMDLKQKLEKEGLFDTSHKKEIPFLPETVGIITSGTGAALQDILNIIRRRFPKMNLTFCPVKVQGDGAAGEIADAIYKMNRLNECDVLIVGRGGGSLEDLWAFNEEIVARAIYQSKIPVISAVGHETDFTISDFVADLRAPTPSAAAELSVPEFTKLDTALKEYAYRLDGVLQKNLERRKDRLRLLKNNPVFMEVQYSLLENRKKLDVLHDALKRGMTEGLLQKRHGLNLIREKLTALSPDCVLNRGFTWITDQNDMLLDSVHKTKVGDSVRICFHDGSADAEIKKIKHGGNENGKQYDI